jgi:hypothetical protein
MSDPDAAALNPPRPPLSRFIWPAAIFFITLIIAVVRAPMGVDVHHDGQVIKAALDVAEGRVLFRETHSPYGMLFVWVQAGALLLFGKTLLTLCMLTAFFHALDMAMIFLLAARLVPRWLAGVAALLWLSMAPFWGSMLLPWSSVYAIFFQVLTIFLLLRHRDTGRHRWAAAAGFAAAMVFGFRQPVGIFLVLSVAFFIISSPWVLQTGFRRSLRTLVFFGLGFFIPVLAMLAVVAVNHALADWYIQTIAMAHGYMTTLGHGAGQTFGLKVLHILTCLLGNGDFVMTSIVVICALYILKAWARPRRGGPADPMAGVIYLTACVGLGSCMQYWPVPCNFHMFLGASPAVAMAAYALWMFFRDLTPRMRNACAVLAMVIAVGYTGLIMGVFSHRYFWRLDGQREIQDEPFTASVIDTPEVLKGMRVHDADKKAFQDIERTVREYRSRHPGAGLIDLDGWANILLTFGGNTPNFHPMAVWSFSGNIYPDFEAKRSAYIRERRPLIISYQDHFEGYVLILRAQMRAKKNIFILAPIEPLEEP